MVAAIIADGSTISTPCRGHEPPAEDGDFNGSLLSLSLSLNREIWVVQATHVTKKRRVPLYDA